MEPQLAAYVQRGDVKLVYRHMIVLGPESQWAAEAVECAGDQGKFWAYHAKLYENQRGVNKGAFTRQNLKRYAQETGLDAAAFSACLDSGRHTVRVIQSTEEARALGIEGTPSFLLGRQVIKGLPPVSALLKAIDERLAGK